jgi:hypothetical protein
MNAPPNSRTGSAGRTARSLGARVTRATGGTVRRIGFSPRCGQMRPGGQMRPEGKGWFQAQYEGKCRGCGAPIYVGEWVRYSREEEKQLYCQSCAVREEEGDDS